jgi:hypothetical protein
MCGVSRLCALNCFFCGFRPRLRITSRITGIPLSASARPRWYDCELFGAATMIRAKRRQGSDEHAETVTRARLVELYTWLFSIMIIALLLAIGSGWLRFD